MFKAVPQRLFCFEKLFGGVGFLCQGFQLFPESLVLFRKFIPALIQHADVGKLEALQLPCKLVLSGFNRLVFLVGGGRKVVGDFCVLFCVEKGGENLFLFLAL